jgi:ADP-heptose:LPS heptosyltransferase
VDVQESVDGFFDTAFDGGKHVVAMHVPVDRAEKQWPFESFAALTDLLLADGRFEVMFTWGPGQLEVVHEVASRCRRAPIIAPETPDLKHFAWLVHRCALYFGGDTGPMHIAALMGTPVVAVFVGTDPAMHAPYQHPHRALVHSVGPKRPDTRIVSPEIAYHACLELTSSGGR